VLCAAGEGEVGPVAEDEPEEPRRSKGTIPSGSGDCPDLLGAGSLGGACRASLRQSIRSAVVVVAVSFLGQPMPGTRSSRRSRLAVDLLVVALRAAPSTGAIARHLLRAPNRIAAPSLEISPSPQADLFAIDAEAEGQGIGRVLVRRIWELGLTQMKGTNGLFVLVHIVLRQFLVNVHVSTCPCSVLEVV
jgi:hypothetical protein